jgi:3D-(3,5/4)-trihydroxycyclohexane-1,2-dione acylhydrolase (decyclizing)
VPYVVVIDTDPYPSTEHGGTWWEVGIPEVSDRAEVRAAHEKYVSNKKLQRAD